MKDPDPAEVDCQLEEDMIVGMEQQCWQHHSVRLTPLIPGLANVNIEQTS